MSERIESKHFHHQRSIKKKKKKKKKNHKITKYITNTLDTRKHWQKGFFFFFFSFFFQRYDLK